MVKFCKCGTQLRYYPGGNYWFCPNETCKTYSLHYNRNGELVKETKTGFSLRPLRKPNNYDIIGEM